MKSDPELEAIIDRQTQEINRQALEIKSLNSRIAYLHEKHSREMGLVLKGIRPARCPIDGGFNLTDFAPSSEELAHCLEEHDL